MEGGRKKIEKRIAPAIGLWYGYSMSTKTTIAITGDTYPVKFQLRALGGTWNRAKQAWMVPAERAEEARRIVREQPVRINEFRFSSGHVAYRNSRGRCEDAPCCGCCTI